MNEKNILYRDNETINRYLGAYRKSVPELQELIDQLKKSELVLPENALQDLFNGGDQIRQQIDKQIEQEASKFQFAAM